MNEEKTVGVCTRESCSRRGQKIGLRSCFMLSLLGQILPFNKVDYTQVTSYWQFKNF